jgi:hypothetical protein
VKIELHAGVPGHDGPLTGRSVQVIQDGTDISSHVRSVAVRCRAGAIITVVLEVYPGELHITGLNSEYVHFRFTWLDRLQRWWYRMRLCGRARRAV